MIPRNPGAGRRFNNNRGGGRPNGGRPNGGKRFFGTPTVLTRTTIFDSSGPSGKMKGTAGQLVEKYVNIAKDFQSQGDDVSAETCRQFADHYMRLCMTLEAEAAEREAARESESRAEAANTANETDENPRPSRSERYEEHRREETETRESNPSEPAAKEIKTEFTVPNVEKMDLSIPISAMSRDGGDKVKRPRGRPRKEDMGGAADARPEETN